MSLIIICLIELVFIFIINSLFKIIKGRLKGFWDEFAKKY
jgi:hypothetical protein